MQESKSQQVLPSHHQHGKSAERVGRMSKTTIPTANATMRINTYQKAALWAMMLAHQMVEYALSAV